MLNAENDAQLLDQVVSFDDIKREPKKWFIRMILFIPALAYYLIILLLLHGAIPEPFATLGLVVTLGLTGVGMLSRIPYQIWGSYVKGVECLQQIEPPEVVITKGYAVTKHKDTYVFVPKSASTAIYFVVLDGTNLSPATKVHVPKNFWRFGSSAEHVNGLRVHKRTGAFSIPTPEPRIASGEGVLYALPFFYIGVGSSVLLKSGMTRENLLAVAEFASKSVSDSVS